MSLTTPPPKELDAALPGEHWFLYWRTSSSLWKTKLSELTGARVIVPINWSFHSETGESFDFGLERPETDLKRLVMLAEQLDKEVHLFVPMTPAPFLPNGGLPHLLARWGAVNPDGMAYAVADPQGPVHKLYSFFDPRVFQAYTKFVHHLGSYLSREGVPAKVWGVECGYMQDGRFQSFMEDRSKAYDTAFARYLAVGREEAQQKAEGALPQELVMEERRLHAAFTKTIRDLYVESASTALAGHWEGALRLGLLGASTEDFLQRACQVENVGKYSSDLLELLIRGVVPSSALLGARARRGVFQRQVDELVTSSMLPLVIGQNALSENRSGAFVPLVFFELYTGQTGAVRSSEDMEEEWGQTGLLDVLRSSYRWTYRFRPIQTFTFEEGFSEGRRIHFLSGSSLTSRNFTQVLKTFMSGGHVVVNRTGLPYELLRKLETFFLENNLAVEKVNVLSVQVHYVSLGDGKMLLFGPTTAAADGTTQGPGAEFWEKALAHFDLPHLGRMVGDDVHFFWRTRSSNPAELNYEEVRRLGLYNHSSYKKRVKIPLTRSFVLMKIIDEVNAVVQSYPNEVEIQLLPEGAVSLDFGVFTN